MIIAKRNGLSQVQRSSSYTKREISLLQLARAVFGPGSL